MTSPEKNEWETKFGAARQALDKKLLADCERALSEPQDSLDSHSPSRLPNAAKNLKRPSTLDGDAERRRIALAFGRPLA
jgi:hypothetical protein